MTVDTTRLRLGIDLDDVLADFRTAFQSVASRGVDEPVDVGGSPQQLDLDSLGSPDLKQVWKTIVNTPNWWTTLPPYEPKQIARLYQLSRRLKWEVYYLTKRPATLGDPVQLQSQWWLEEQGFYLPSVMTVGGSRGELANALRLDLVIDDQFLNCIEVISGSFAKSVLLLRDDQEEETRSNAKARGIGVVATLEEAIDVAERLHELLRERRGPIQRLTEWFPWSKERGSALPLNPRESHPLPSDE